MIFQVFCVKDRAIEAFGTPMFLQAVGQAVRSFSDEVNREDKQNQLFMHPDDFDLWQLGTWDSDTAVFTPLERMEQVAIGKNVKVRS